MAQIIGLAWLSSGVLATFWWQDHGAALCAAVVRLVRAVGRCDSAWLLLALVFAPGVVLVMAGDLLRWFARRR